MKHFLAICTVALLALPVFAQKKMTKHPHMKAHTAASSTTKDRVYNDATRLAALLQDAQTTDSVDSNVWKVVANEANSLANKLYGSTSGSSAARKDATDARTHVRAFRDAALSGDAAGARTHASEAMPYVTKLIDWSMPAKS